MCPGLLLYNGQLSTGYGDFLSLGLRNGRVEFRFDVGSGPAIISSAEVAMNQWHSVRIRRDKKQGLRLLKLK